MLLCCSKHAKTIVGYLGSRGYLLESKEVELDYGEYYLLATVAR